MTNNPTGYQIEACVESFEEAWGAHLRGAHQIELCSNLALEGLTPLFDDIEKCIQNLPIPCKVMIRPFSGSFITETSALEKMLKQIEQVKLLGVRHIVAGLTTPGQKLDIASIKRMKEDAYPMTLTIHKAIDSCADPLEELQRLLDCGGIDSVLTSGGADTAENGAALIRKMIDISGDELNIIAAGGITHDNLPFIDQLIGAKFYHGRKIVGKLH